MIKRKCKHCKQEIFIPDGWTEGDVYCDIKCYNKENKLEIEQEKD